MKDSIEIEDEGEILDQVQCHLDTAQHEITRVETSLTFQVLPVEIKMLVFSYLTHQELCESVAPVCREWYELSRHPSLRTHLEVNFFSWVSQVSKKQKLLQLLSSCTMLNKLVIKGENVDYVTHEVLDHAFPCNKMRTLEIHRSRLSITFFRKLAIECPLLESLTINDCLVYGDHLAMAHAITDLENIKHLNLKTWGTPLEDSSLMILLDKCKNLVSLIDTCLFGTNQVFHTIATYAKDRLRVLRIGGCEVTDDGMIALASCTCLVDLLIEEVLGFGDRSLDALSSLGFESFGINWSRFSNGSTVPVSSEALIRFLSDTSRRSLRRFYLCRFLNFNDYVLERLRLLCPDLTHLGFRMCDKVTDAGLQRYLDGNTKIRCLNITCADGLTNEMVQNIPDSVEVVLEDVFYNPMLL